MFYKSYYLFQYTVIIKFVQSLVLLQIVILQFSKLEKSLVKTKRYLKLNIL